MVQNRHPPASPHPAASDALPSQRPGVPMERVPRPFPSAHLDSSQRPRVKVFKFKGRKKLPPVFSNAQPPSGVSGLMRRVAYHYPEHMARHFLWLLYADRVNVLERRAGKLLRRGLKLAVGLWVLRAAVRELQRA